MESSWAVAAVLVEIDGLADMLGERHRIIANDWQAAEMISRAADLCCDSAGLVHDNERRWRTFRHRVGQVLEAEHGVVDGARPTTQAGRA